MRRTCRRRATSRFSRRSPFCVARRGREVDADLDRYGERDVLTKALTQRPSTGRPFGSRVWAASLPCRMAITREPSSAASSRLWVT